MYFVVDHHPIERFTKIGSRNLKWGGGGGGGGMLRATLQVKREDSGGRCLYIYRISV